MKEIHRTPKKYKYGRMVDEEKQRADSRKRTDRLKKEREEFHNLFLGLGNKSDNLNP